MFSEFLVIGVLGSLLLGPKKMAKLMADVTRIKQQFSAKKDGLLRQLEEELSVEAVPGGGVRTLGPERAPEGEQQVLSNEISRP